MPAEIITMIVSLIIPVGETITIDYLSYIESLDTASADPRETRPWNARSLMRVNRYLDQRISFILYNLNTFRFEQDVEEALPLFLQNLRAQTLRILRLVDIVWRPRMDLSVGLDLLLCCSSLQSLYIDNRTARVVKVRHKKLLRCLRLTDFRYVNDDGWLNKVSDIILSQKPRTRKEESMVVESREDKVRTRC